MTAQCRMVGQETKTLDQYYSTVVTVVGCKVCGMLGKCRPVPTL